MRFHMNAVTASPKFQVVIPKEIREAMKLRDWDQICSEIPNEWFFSDQEMTVPADFDLNTIFNTLNRCNDNSLWEMT